MSLSPLTGHGRDRRPRSRLWAVIPVVVALVGSAGYAMVASEHTGRSSDAMQQDWRARTGGQQVLGDERTPGVPSIQRLRHDRVTFTVTIAPARPGPNLVRVDALGESHHGGKPVRVGTSEATLVPARPRPGSDGRFAVVDLPEGSGTVLVSHGRDHRVPFAVDTGSEPADPLWAGPDGPECLAVQTATVLAGDAPATCPSGELGEEEATALREVVDTLVGRGITQLAVLRDDSARSEAAYELVASVAEPAGVRVVGPGEDPSERSALLAVSGWETAARRLGEVSAMPLRRQPVRTDGTWLAPWLLTPGVLDSTAGVVVPLDFDIRDPDAKQFGDVLATYLPGQAPTGSAYTAWRAAQGTPVSPVRLHAASRAAYMPKLGRGHVGHETQVAWFPGGTVTPIS